MKNIILFIILGCLSLYGFSINPIALLAKAGEPVNTITTQSPVTTEECSNLYSLVTVNYTVTFTDCPFTCKAPCPFLCIKLTDGTNDYEIKSWNSGCTYYFNNLRIEEGTTIWVQFYNPTGCTVVWNNNTTTPQVVPTGGGNLSGSMYYCP
jgi:hypothetical protein